METEPPSTELARLLGSLAADAGDVTSATVVGVTEYRRGEAIFAACAGGVAEFNLDPELADAARRTTAATLSQRGPGWVRFAPVEIDRYALDRARAWFLSAWRRSGPAGGAARGPR